MGGMDRSEISVGEFCLIQDANILDDDICIIFVIYKRI